MSPKKKSAASKAFFPTLRPNEKGILRLEQDDTGLHDEAWLPIGDSEMPYPVHLHQIGDNPNDIRGYELWSVPGNIADQSDHLKRGLFVKSYHFDKFYHEIKANPKNYSKELKEVRALVIDDTSGSDGQPRKRISTEEKIIALARQKAAQRIVGQSFREMPAPSALPAFTEVLRIYEEEEGLPVPMIVGPPGIGKTYLASMLGRLKDPRGAIHFDCGGKDMTELIDRLVFKNSAANQSLQNDIDRKLDKETKATLSPESIEGLEELRKVGIARFTDESETKYQILWEQIGSSFDMNGGNAPEGAVSDEDAAKNVVLDHGTNEERWQKIRTAINKICSGEHLKTSIGSDDFPFEIEDGLLLEAYQDDRPIILDELNRYRKDSIEGFRNIFLFLTKPDQPEFNYTRKNGTVVTFSRDKLLKSRNFSIIATGNDQSASETTARDLDASLKERFQMVLAPQAQKLDFAHRFCQEMTGLPVITLAMQYGINLDNPDENPVLANEFDALLRRLSDMGMTEEEKAKDPRRTFKQQMLGNWKNVIKSSIMVANSYHDLWQVFYDTGNAISSDGSDAGVSAELSSPKGYKTNISPGMRLMLKHIKKAVEGNVMATVPPAGVGRPQADALDRRLPQRRPTTSSAKTHGTFGEAMSMVADQFLRDKMQLLGKPMLWKRVRQTFEDNGLVDPEVSIQAKANAPIHIRELLTDTPVFSLPDDEIGRIRALVQARIREKHKLPPGATVEIHDDEIIGALSYIEELSEGKAAIPDKPHPRVNTIALLNEGPDMLDSRTAGNRRMFEDGFVADAARDVFAGEPSLVDDIANLPIPDHDRLVVAMATPTVGEFVRKQLWTDGLEHTGLVPDEKLVDISAVKIAQHKFIFPIDKDKKEHSELGVTTLITQKEDPVTKAKKDEVIHVIHREKPNQTIVVGGAQPTSVRQFLRSLQIANRGKPDAEKQSLFYVNRYDLGAEKSLEDLIRHVTGSEGASRDEHAKLIGTLKDAFFIRNRPSEKAQAENIKDLAKFMITPEYTDTILPTYALCSIRLHDILEKVEAPHEGEAQGEGRGGGK